MKEWAREEYFAADSPDRGLTRDGDPLVSQLKAQIRTKIPHCESIVRQAVKDWNQKARIKLRDESGLRLVFNKKPQSVPVKVVDGIPLSLVNILETEKISLALLSRKQQIADANELLNWIQGSAHLIPEAMNPVPPEPIKECQSWLSCLLAHLESQPDRVVEAIIDRNCFGAYWFRIPEITIHWVVIGLFSVRRNMSPRELTMTSLFHELAHAYHHLGFDIDGLQFNVDMFARSENSVIEGIAQAYTFHLVDWFSEDQPLLMDTWHKKQESCSPIYKLNKHWLSGKREKEILRDTIIRTRVQERSTPLTMAHFEEVLESMRKDIESR